MIIDISNNPSSPSENELIISPTIQTQTESISYLDIHTWNVNGLQDPDKLRDIHMQLLTNKGIYLIQETHSITDNNNRIFPNFTHSVYITKVNVPLKTVPETE